MHYPTTPAPLIFFLACLLGLACGEKAQERVPADLWQALPARVDYNFHIRPLLADRCFSCHGFDEAARKADLRLDVATRAFAKNESGHQAFFPGKVARSEAWHRIYSEDPEYQMPPPESNLQLSEYEKALIAKWIEQGAEYQPHWAFTPIQKPPLPPLVDSTGIVNPIDRFVLARLEQQGLQFSPQADPARLLRRVTLDLTGLPPTPEAIDAFLADSSPDAYTRVVDQLLASDAHAERMALDWLDVARYADSHGLHSDGWRSMYPWRDWVIQAFQENMPYDQFLTWQLAGDLLPQPTRTQRVATGFNRNHKITAEGGIVDEEYRQEYVHDRTITTATAFMGLTLECARCHDHKYDPLSQEAYYRFFAFFNQVDELGMSGDDGNAGPNLLLPSPATESRLADLRQQIQEKEQSLALEASEVRKQQQFLRDLQRSSMGLEKNQEIYLPCEQISGEYLDGKKTTKVAENVSIESSDRGNVLRFDSEYEYITLKEVGIFDQQEAFAAALWIRPDERRTSQTLMGNSDPKANFWRGWEFFLDSLNHLSLRLIHALPHDVAWVYSNEALPIQAWSHVAFSYDGSGSAAGIRLYLNGHEQALTVRYDKLQRSIHPSDRFGVKRKKDLRIGRSYRAFTGEYGIFQGMMDEIRIFRRALSPYEIQLLAEKNPPASEDALFATWEARHQSPTASAIATLRKAALDLLDTVPEVMVMEDISQPRTTYVLHRGQYDQPGHAVTPGTPASILPFPDSLPPNRLGLAQWMTSSAHPLTSRVIVNRYWQLFFGRGIVETPHDFGMQGSLPSHPALLDWLAASLMENGWNLRALQRQIVLSTTYRQSSFAHPELREKDPNNRLLGRGPTYRLSAEMIRDQALSASGLLSPVIGGPSAKPVQPAGLWAEKTSSTIFLLEYHPDSGDARYRRSLYTFVRRTSPPPNMSVFDAPNRSVCTVSRSQTNTPMQALVLLNDPQMVEASRALATRVMRERTGLDAQITYAFRLLTGSSPDAQQLRQMSELFERRRQQFAQTPEQARAFLAIGQYPPDPALPQPALAAMTVVANTILNFDEAYMKR